ncbi:MAG: CapA family protein [Oscillospiraceae bacterium]|nr:CapA family protein [Oscillospiraceae bacterium]
MSRFKKVLILPIVILLIIITSCNDDTQEEELSVPAAAGKDSSTEDENLDEIINPPGTETPAASQNPAPVPEILPEPQEPEYLTVKACAAGDNLIHSPIYNQAARRAGEEGGYNFLPAYENVTDIIAGYELAMLNQETLICNDIKEPSNYPYFNSPAALGDFMLNMGFNVFSIANNHTLDQGVTGLETCLDYWRIREKEHEAVVVGAYYNKEDRANIRTKEINGIIFSFLSYTEHLNGLILPSDSALEIGDSKNLDIVTAEIKKAKEISDVCVVFLHWGTENYDQIENYQRIAAKQMADAGADVILGTHPHVLRDIELIEREDSTQTLCAYSLGNFISAQNIPQTMIGGILSFEVVMNSETREIEINMIQLNPTITHYDHSYGFVRIYPLSEYNENLAVSHGVREFGVFSLNYIHDILSKNISSKWLSK